MLKYYWDHMCGYEKSTERIYDRNDVKTLKQGKED